MPISPGNRSNPELAEALTAFHQCLWEQSIASSIRQLSRNPLHSRLATLAKWFTLKEQLRAQIAVQMFNAFNHPNFGIPNAGVGSPTMGLASSTQGARQMQGVLKVTF